MTKSKLFEKETARQFGGGRLENLQQLSIQLSPDLLTDDQQTFVLWQKLSFNFLTVGFNI